MATDTTGASIPILLLNSLGFVLLGAMAFVAVTSWREREPRATRVAVAFAIGLSLPCFAVGLLPIPHQESVAVALLSLMALGALYLLLPSRVNTPPEPDLPTRRIDERDIMFSRRLLAPGSARFEAYYGEHPDKKPLDDRFRAAPGLLAKGSALFDAFQFSAAEASFRAVQQFHPIVDVTASSDCAHVDPAAVTSFIKSWAKKLGAVSVGVTEMRECHWYTHVGRGLEYGRPVDCAHEFGIAMTVEMDKDYVDHAPLGPTVMESAQQYLASGAIAVQVAEFIRQLGYDARAHIDGNYRVLCPLVARDAGLGEIGRMGLLMSPELGPRVRIAVVTTSLPLIPDQRRRDPTMLDFCTRCRKCAEACPSRAIPFDNRSEIDGVRRWRINSEACFTFWCTVGTDCARCMRVCPYSHPSNWMHNAVRRAVKNSSRFRDFALRLDDVFYGRLPPSRLPPEWMHVDANRSDSGTPPRDN